MIKFYLPFYYLFYSRLKTKVDLISWIIIFIIPQFIITYSYMDLKLDIFVPLFLLSQLIFNTLYEIGYLENDISTTKNEKNPTLRLDTKSNAYIKNNYSKIIYFRYLTVLLSIGLLYWANSYFVFELNMTAFIILLVINRIFFFFHNTIRNKLNLITFSVLAVTKYIFPLVLFVSIENMLYPILLSVLVFPLLRIIEHSTHRRYDVESYAKIIGDHDRFRVIYYLVGIAGYIILWYFAWLSSEDFNIAISIFLYFLFYRLASYLLVKRGIYKRDMIKSKDLYRER